MRFYFLEQQAAVRARKVGAGSGFRVWGFRASGFVGGGGLGPTCSSQISQYLDYGPSTSNNGHEGFYYGQEGGLGRVSGLQVCLGV